MAHPNRPSGHGLGLTNPGDLDVDRDVVGSGSRGRQLPSWLAVASPKRQHTPRHCSSISSRSSIGAKGLWDYESALGVAPLSQGGIQGMFGGRGFGSDRTLVSHNGCLPVVGVRGVRQSLLIKIVELTKDDYGGSRGA